MINDRIKWKEKKRFKVELLIENLRYFYKIIQSRTGDMTFITYCT